MPRFTAVALALAVSLGTAPVVFGAVKDDPVATGGVEGRAWAADRSPLANHTIQLRDVQTGQLAGSALTNAAGRFTVTRIPPGSYLIEIVDPAGNIVGTARIAVVAGTVSAIVVTATASRRPAGGAFLTSTPGLLVVAGGIAAATAAVVVATRREELVEICLNGRTIRVARSAASRDIAGGRATPGPCPASPAQ